MKVLSPIKKFFEGLHPKNWMRADAGEGRNNFGDSHFSKPLLCIMLAVFCVFALKAWNIRSSRAVSDENNIVALDTPEGGQLTITRHGEFYFVEGVDGVGYFGPSGIITPPDGLRVTDNCMFLFGDTIYRFERSGPDACGGSVVYRKALNFVGSPLKIGSPESYREKVVFHPSGGAGEYAWIVPVKENNRPPFGPDDSVVKIRAKREGLRVVNGVVTRPLSSEPGAFGYLADGDVVEGAGGRFIVNLRDEVSTDPDDYALLRKEKTLTIRSALPLRTSINVTGQDGYGAVMVESGVFIKKKGAARIALGNSGEIEVTDKGAGIKLRSMMAVPVIVREMEQEFVLEPGGTWDAGGDIQVDAGDRGSCRAVRTGEGIAVFNTRDRENRRYPLSPAKPNLVLTMDRLAGTLTGNVIPDTVTDRSGAALMSSRMTFEALARDRGFLNETGRLKAIPRVRRFIKSYNRMRCTVGLMPCGEIFYEGPDNRTRKVDLNSRIKWLAREVRPGREPAEVPWDADFYNDTGFRPADTRWKWAPPVSLYWDTRFTGKDWLWYPEPWHPADQPPGGRITRYFKGKFNVGGEVVGLPEMLLLADAGVRVRINGREAVLPAHSAKLLDSLDGAWCVPIKIKLADYLVLGENVIEIIATKRFPSESPGGRAGLLAFGNIGGRQVVTDSTWRSSACRKRITGGVRELGAFTSEPGADGVAGVPADARWIWTDEREGFFSTKGGLERFFELRDIGRSTGEITVLSSADAVEFLVNGRPAFAPRPEPRGRLNLFASGPLSFGNTSNRLTIRVVQEHYYPFGKVGPAEILRGYYPELPGVAEVTTRSRHISRHSGKKGRILDRDGYSNPRLVLEKGCDVLPAGSVFMLDFERGGTGRNKRKKVYLALYDKEHRGNMGVDSRTCFGPVFCADSYGVDLSAASDMISVKEDPRGGGPYGFLSLLNFSVTKQDGALKVSYNCTGPVKRPGDGKCADRQLKDGDVINCEGLIFRYREDGGVLAGDEVTPAGFARRYQEAAGLYPIVGYAGPALSPSGAEAIFGKVLGGESGRPARDVALTIDDDLQRAAMMELTRGVLDRMAKDGAKFDNSYPPKRKYESAFVLMDAVTGEILAAATWPVTDYDPEKLRDAAEFDRINGGRSSLVERCWKDVQYHPGSTFKLVTATAALAATHMNDPFYDKVKFAMSHKSNEWDGYRKPGGVRDMTGMSLPGAREGQGDIKIDLKLKNFELNRGSPETDSGADLTNAIAHSYNTYFGYLALLLNRPVRDHREGQGFCGEEATREQNLLAHYAERFGYNSVFDLVPKFRDGELMGLLERHAGDEFYAEPSIFPLYAPAEGLVAQTGFGQGDVYATPLQQCMVAAALASDEGMMPHPVIIKGISGAEMAERRPAVRVIADAGDVQRIRDGMREVIYSGTGSGVFNPDSGAKSPLLGLIYAKSGSAQRAAGKDGATDSWFAGFVEPPQGYSGEMKHRLAFCCVVGDGGLGAKVSGRICDSFLAKVCRYYGWIQ